jgi:hypothetical protein
MMGGGKLFDGGLNMYSSVYTNVFSMSTKMPRNSVKFYFPNAVEFYGHSDWSAKVKTSG